MIWTNKEIKLLKDNYHKVKLSDMPKIISSRNKKAIQIKASRLGLKNVEGSKVKYICNENFFSDKSLLSCYWAGFIAADGFRMTDLKERNEIDKLFKYTLDSNKIAYEEIRTEDVFK